MLGAIAGDIIGSVYEWRSIKTTEFPLFDDERAFTDDSVLTIAVADALLGDGDFEASLRSYARRYPDAGYGASFKRWSLDPAAGPYDSYGNGSAMRVSAVAWFAETEDQALDLANRSAVPTHNHPEGVKGAQATALAIWLARDGSDAEAIRDAVSRRFGYDLSRDAATIRPGYGFDVTCQGSVPEAICCALEAKSFEDAVRLAVSLGGDADTQACIAGAIAEARFGLPRNIAKRALGYLDDDLRSIVVRFRRRYMSKWWTAWKP